MSTTNTSVYLKKVGDFDNPKYKINFTTFVDSSGMIWFDATEVCLHLKYGRDAATVIERLDDDEKILLNRGTFDSTSGVGRGGAQFKWFVNEFGLYSLILASEKKEAKKIKRWITHEVLPEIRKSGSYSSVKKDIMIKEIISRYTIVNKNSWTKTFPDIYYQELSKMFNLGNHYPGKSLPPVAAFFTSTYVWSAMPPGVYNVLKEKNPYNEDGKNRKYKHHQFCSKTAKDHLAEHLKNIIVLIRSNAYQYERFKIAFRNAFPGTRYDKLIENEKNIDLIMNGQVEFAFM